MPQKYMKLFLCRLVPLQVSITVTTTVTEHYISRLSHFDPISFKGFQIITFIIIYHLYISIYICHLYIYTLFYTLSVFWFLFSLFQESNIIKIILGFFFFTILQHFSVTSTSTNNGYFRCCIRNNQCNIFLCYFNMGFIW